MQEPDTAEKGRLEALTNERDALVRMQNVLTHEDWREVYLYLTEHAARFRAEMESAHNWEQFSTARALKAFLEEHLMHLPTIVRDSIDRIEQELAAAMVAEEEVLDPPEYED